MKRDLRTAAALVLTAIVILGLSACGKPAEPALPEEQNARPVVSANLTFADGARAEGRISVLTGEGQQRTFSWNAGTGSWDGGESRLGPESAGLSLPMNGGAFLQFAAACRDWMKKEHPKAAAFSIGYAAQESSQVADSTAEARDWCAEGGWALLAYSVSAGKLRAATEEDDGLAASVAYLQWLEGDAQSAPAIFILP